ncbi:hypothetical protein HZA76_04290 [Candidatus Roizmanbacteria bacterium]|nr:hypothetical protein [Candidatus Roizmanbacteria bacterium]
MKKETIFAVFLGIVFGGLLGLFLISKNKEIQLNKNKVIAPTGLNDRSVPQTDLNFQPLDISEPKDSSVLDNSSVSIKGKATVNSLIVIQSPIRDMVLKNEKQDFKVDFPLALGENIIRVVIYPENKQLSIQEKSLRVYYLQESL